MSKKTFILSDETVNQYGFIVLTAGIKLDRFKLNPVMLNEHKLGLNDVIGNWTDLRVEGKKLMADTDFDMEDEAVKSIARKVDKGYIKGASVWVDFGPEDVKLDVKGYEGKPVVVNSELMEASIVSVPNNKNALKLSVSGEFLKDTSLALKLSAGEPINNHNNETNMKELALIFAALGLKLTANSTPEHAVEAIEALKTERDGTKTKLAEAEVKLAADKTAKVTALIEGAIAGKKLTADKKDHFTKLASQDFETTKAIIDGMTEHVTLSSKLGAGDEGGGKNPFEGKGFKELMKTSEGSKYLLKLKVGSDTEKAEYKKLWVADFPGGVFNG